MGLSRKKPSSNLMILRSKLSDITIGEGVDVKDDENVAMVESPPIARPAESNIIKKVKRGRKKDELIDGSRLLTC